MTTLRSCISNLPLSSLRFDCLVAVVTVVSSVLSGADLTLAGFGTNAGIGSLHLRRTTAAGLEEQSLIQAQTIKAC